MIIKIRGTLTVGGLLIAGGVIFVGLLFILQPNLQDYCDAKFPTAGNVITDRLLASDISTVLVSPAGSKKTMLLSRTGEILHTWQTERTGFIAYLQPNGHLFSAQTKSSNLKYPGGGHTGIVQEFDWDGKVLWQYEDEYMHHDFEVMPDGGIAYIQWERAPDSFAVGVRGGAPPQGGEIWTDAIVVVDREKNITWEWHMYEHLDPARYPVNTFASATDWSHANSVRYVENNPITNTPAFLLSVRHISTVFLIDAVSGEIIWESPVGVLSLQHDATLLDSGNILVFDNALFKNTGRANYWSRVVEIDPRSDKIVWTYESGGDDASTSQRSFFASSIMGGAQRLDNGNTLITSSTQGRITEVAPNGEIIWDYFNEFRKNSDPRAVFKARVYDTPKSLNDVRGGILHRFCNPK